MRPGRLNVAGLALFAVSAVAGAACDRTDLVIELAHALSAGPGPTTISISGDRICAVGGAPAHSPATTAIDAQGMTVLPGLIDAHAHLFPMGSSAEIDSDAMLEHYIRSELPARLRGYLERGVTTVFSVGDAWPAIRNLREMISNGEILGPRLFITGPILTAQGGYPAVTICANSPWCRARLTVELRDAEHARRTVRELAAAGVDAIKVVYDDARAEKLDAQLVRTVAEEADALGLPVIAHSSSVTDALAVTELGAGTLAHLPSAGVVDEAIATEFRRRGVIVISTAGVYAPVVGPDGARRTVFGLRYGPPFDRLHAQGLANVRVLIEAGVPVAFGSGTPMFAPGQSLDGEIAALSLVSITARELLDAMTTNAALALGKEAELGSIEVGRRADLILVAADDNSGAIADVIVVIKNGRIVVDRRES
jgi:imidazolonepropionase-like amidohydrolase